MQYLLTAEEISNLTDKARVTQRDEALALAREKLLSQAGFDCIHDKNGRNSGGYCDDCPCSPLHNRRDYKLWSLVCGQTPHYSK